MDDPSATGAPPPRDAVLYRVTRVAPIVLALLVSLPCRVARGDPALAAVGPARVIAIELAAARAARANPADRVLTSSCLGSLIISV
jgi:hypothetical protein